MEGKPIKVHRIEPQISNGSISTDPTKICVFTGAGIGVPLKLPTTDQFVETIDEIQPELLIFINSFLGSKRNDIEKVLYLLEDFIRIDDFNSHIIKVTHDPSFTLVRQHLNQHKEWARKAVLRIKSNLYDLLEAYDSKEASNLYSALISEIKAAYTNPSISFFTTNYDLTFENGFAEDGGAFLLENGIEDVYYGFTGKNKATYDPGQRFQWQQNIIEYKKLHGSLDWITGRKQDCIRTGENVKPRNPEDMPMLYPGFKGIPSKQPFIDLHEQFSDRLSEADVLIVIGFAFRDQYLNNVFDAALKRNNKLRVLCYNPAEIKDLPEDSEMGRLATKYPKRFHHIKKFITLEDNPLSLFDQVAFA